MGFFRAAEPTVPSWVEDDVGDDGWAEPAAPTGLTPQEVENAASSLWQPRKEWLADGYGRSTLYERSAEEVNALAQKLQDASEAARMTAAGQLAHTSGCHGIEPLVSEMRRAMEAPARAATYGLAAAGDAAVPPLIALLEGTAAPVPSGSASSSISTDRPLYRKDKIAYALGRAATTADSITNAVDALAAA
jgi:hypothetical protein